MMAVRHCFGVAVILVFVICRTSSWPQSYASRRTVPERRDGPSPTNEVYSSQLNQPTTPEPQRGSFVRRPSTTPPTLDAVSGRQAGRQTGVKVASSTSYVPARNLSDGGVVVGQLMHRNVSVVTGFELDTGNMTKDEALDEVIKQIFNVEEAMASGRHVGDHTSRYNPQDTTAAGKSRIRLPTSGDIVFPDATKEGSTRYHPPPIVPCPNGHTFCDHVPRYPESLVNSLLHKASALKTYFGTDVVTLSNVTQRIDLPEDMPICTSIESVVYPKQGKNMDDMWLYIVNVPNGYQQGVRVETCSGSTENDCEFTNFMYGYKSFCKQKYISRKMVTLHPESGNLIPDSIKLPACCSCHVRPIDVASTRSAIDPATQSRAMKPASRRRRDRRVNKAVLP